MRLIATGGIIGIAVVLGAILVGQDVAGWIVGLVVGLTSVILAALLWSSRQDASRLPRPQGPASAIYSLLHDRGLHVPDRSSKGDGLEQGLVELSALKIGQLWSGRSRRPSNTAARCDARHWESRGPLGLFDLHGSDWRASVAGAWLYPWAGGVYGRMYVRLRSTRASPTESCAGTTSTPTVPTGSMIFSRCSTPISSGPPPRRGSSARSGMAAPEYVPGCGASSPNGRTFPTMRSKPSAMAATSSRSSLGCAAYRERPTFPPRCDLRISKMPQRRLTSSASSATAIPQTRSRLWRTLRLRPIPSPNGALLPEFVAAFARSTR